ncbi:MAG: FtsX-like permease family protein [Nitrospirota bacterium]|nr:FtsX-like permease family protein [Nitrospirota bacterium]
MRNPLLALAFHHLLHRPIRVGVTVFGVAVGVSAVLAMHLANQEIFRSFENSVTRMVGEATIQITGTDRFLDENIIPLVHAHQLVHSVTPLLEVSALVSVPSEQDKALPIWALDVLDLVDRSMVENTVTQGPREFLDLLLEPNTLFLGQEIASRLNVTEGQSLDIRVGSQLIRVTIGGILNDNLNGGSFSSLGIMDIAAAQSLFGLIGRVSRVDIATEPGADVDQVIQDLKNTLGVLVLVERSARRTGQVEQMLRSFQLNLMTLSTVGLFVGVFLIYNAVGFSVVQYRREIGILRAIGTFRHQIAALFLGEAAVIGILGGVLGAGLGLVLATFLISLEGQTVSELYASVDVHSISVTPWTFFSGAGLGMLLALLGAIAPCLEASRTLPARALAAGQYEQTVIARPYLMAACSLTVFCAAAILTVPDAVDGIPVFGYGAAFCILLGSTLLAPLSLQVLKGVASLPFQMTKGLVPQLSVDQILRSPGRYSVTLSALLVGIAIVISVGVMVKSFRDTVEMWIDQTLMADVIVSPQSGLSDAIDGERAPRFSYDMIQAAAAVRGVVAVDPYRQLRVSMGEHDVVLVSRDLSIHASRSQYLFVHGDSPEVLEKALTREGAIVSEVLAERLQIGNGETLVISSGGKELSLEVVGIFYDYATDGGKVVIDRALYQRMWGDSSATVLAVYGEPSIPQDTIRTRLHDVLDPMMPVSIISNHELRQEILEIFDRTFRMTYGLELIAVVVGVLGIINTLMTTVIERRREFATFRALGAGIHQIRHMVLWESFFVGVLGVILGIGGGLLLGALLVFVINKQSFGWTIQFVLSGRTVLEAIMVGGVASLVAGYLPARWVLKGPIAEGLRYE